MRAEKPVYSPKPKAVVEDLGTGKIYHVGANDRITMTIKYKTKSGRKRTRTRKYKVVEVSRKDKHIVIEDRKLKKYTITAKAFMPRIKQIEQATTKGRGVPRSSAGFIDAPPGGRSKRWR